LSGLVSSECSDSYALESRRRLGGETGRTRLEDPEHDVVDEVMYAATTLRDMGRGERMRAS